MKKVLAILLVVLMLGAFAACKTEDVNDVTVAPEATAEETLGEINVVSREEGSGTRGAFVELTGVEIKDADGKKIDMTTEDAEVTNSTTIMMTSVANNKAAIGYISLGSLDSTVKALNFEGVTPSAATVKDGSYKLARPFLLVTKDKLSAPAQDFYDFILSKEGQEIVKNNHYVALDNAPDYAASGAKGKVVVAGSSSVSPLMEKLIEAYKALNSDVEIKLETSDSGTGIKSAQDGICDIGMSSRDLKDTETGVEGTKICMDGIVVIVNNDNPITNITKEQVAGIYTGEITDWADVA